MHVGLQVMGLQVGDIHPGSLALISEGPFGCVVSRHLDVRQTGQESGRINSQSVQTVVCMRPCSRGPHQDLEPSGRKEWFPWASHILAPTHLRRAEVDWFCLKTWAVHLKDPTPFQ